MRALVFGVEPEPGNEQESGAGRLTRNLAATPMGLRKILTHTFPMEQVAVGALADQGSSGAVKVAFDLR